MWRLAGMAILAVVVVATVAHAAAMTGTSKRLGAGTATIPHVGGTCQLTSSTANQSSDVISSVTVTVSCSTTATYDVQATVVSGAASQTGSATVSLTANTPTAVTVTLPASVDTTTPDAYTITYVVTPL